MTGGLQEPEGADAIFAEFSSHSALTSCANVAAVAGAADRRITMVAVTVTANSTAAAIFFQWKDTPGAAASGPPGAESLGAG